MVVCGAVAGPVVQLDLRRLYLQRRRLIGSTMHTGEQFRRLVETARRGDLHPTVAGSRPLSEVHLAQDDLLRGEFTGKIVLVPGR